MPPRLTIGQLAQLNHGRIKLPSTVEQIFTKYTKSVIAKDYHNPHNPYLYIAPSAKVAEGTRRTAISIENSEEQILRDFRAAFTSISADKTGVVRTIKEINRMVIPASQLSKIAELFIEVMIQCPMFAEQYITVLFTIDREDKMETRLRLEVCKMIMHMLKNPVTLPDNKVSTSQVRTIAHRAAICEIATHLFNYTYPAHMTGPKLVFDNYEELRKRLLDPVFVHIETDTDPTTRGEYIRILVKMMLNLQKVNKFPKTKADYQERVQKLLKDKTIPARFSVLLMDLE